MTWINRLNETRQLLNEKTGTYSIFCHHHWNYANFRFFSFFPFGNNDDDEIHPSGEIFHQAKAHQNERVGWILENVSDTLFNHFETLLHCSSRLLLRHQILAHFFIVYSLLSLRHVALNDWRCYNKCDFNRKQLINITTRNDALRYINHRLFFLFN